MASPAAFIPICGVEVPVFVGTPKDNESLVGAWGCYEPEDICIWIHEDTPKHILDGVIIHEVLHALIHLSGLLYELCSAFGLTRADPRIDAWEESLVRRLVPHISETFGGPMRRLAKQHARGEAQVRLIQPIAKGKHASPSRPKVRGTKALRGRGVRPRIQVHRQEARPGTPPCHRGSSRTPSRAR